MPEQLYDLMIEGIDQTQDISALTRRVSTLCQLSPAAVDIAIGDLIAGFRKAVILKKGLSRPAAEQYKAHLAQMGLNARIVEPLGLMPLEVTVEKKEFICPACDHRQPLTEAGDDAQCSNCGIIRSKYLKREKSRKIIERERRLAEAKEQYEIEKQSQEAQRKEEEQMAAGIRRQLDKDHSTPGVSIARILKKTNTVYAKAAAAIILTISAIPISYLVYQNYAKDHGVAANDEHAIDFSGRRDQLPGKQSDDTLAAAQHEPPATGQPGHDESAAKPTPNGQISVQVAPGTLAVAVAGVGGSEPVNEGSAAVAPASSAPADMVADHPTTDYGVMDEPISEPVANDGSGSKSPGAIATSLGSASTGTAAADGATAKAARGPKGVAKEPREPKGPVPSRQTLHQALSLAGGIRDPAEQTIALSSIVSLQSQLGDIPAAQGTLRKATEIAHSIRSTGDAQRAGNWLGKARCELSAAKALFNEKPDDARSNENAAAEATGIAQGIIGVEEKVAALSTIAQYLARSGRIPAAERLFNDGFVAATTIASRREYVAALSHISAGLLKAGDPVSARKVVTEMLDNAKRIANIQDRMITFSMTAAQMSALQGEAGAAQELFQGAYQFAAAMDDEQERAAVLDAINTFRAQSLAEAGGRLAASERDSGAREMFEKAASAANEIRSAGQKVVALVSIGTGQARRPVTTPQRPLLTVALSDQVSDPARSPALDRFPLVPASPSLSEGRRIETGNAVAR